MEHKLTIILPDRIYQPLVEEALREGRTPEEEAALRLERCSPPVNNKQVQGFSLEQFFGSVSLGHATGADNESIDRDLARVYANEDES
jgi:hypothetical protein